MTADLDAARDLTFERVVPLTPEQMWAGWTQPDHLVRWFTPAPWTTAAAEVDLRPGGAFRTTLRSPEGDEHHNVGCYLVVEAPHRLVWTGALGPGFRPLVVAEGGFAFTAEITFEAVDGGTRYTAHLMHDTPEARDRHEAMGFADGWGAALDQLVDHLTGR